MGTLSSSVDALFATAADPAYLLDRSGTILRVNRVACLTFSELDTGSDIHDMAAVLRWETAGFSFSRCIERGESSFDVLKDDGGRARFEVSLVPVHEQAQEIEAVLITVINLMGEIMREERLRMLSLVFDSITEGVLTLDHNARVTGMNKSTAKLLGVTEEEVKLKPVTEILWFKNAGEKASLLEAIGKRKRMEVTAGLQAPYGRALSCFISLAPLEGAVEGYHGGFVITLKDRTEQVEMEQHLIQMEKMNSLGRLVAGFAHELNNPLTSVIGFAQLMLDNSAEKPFQEETKVIHDHALRCKRIIDNLLAFSRKHVPEKKPVDIEGVVLATEDLLKYQIERIGVKTKLNLEKNLPLVKADPSQIQQVLVNLIENACYELDNMSVPGEITVTTECLGESVRIAVTDNGAGIPENIISKVFDPFFTTKPLGVGTGLGLSLSYGIVQEHKGRLSARNRKSGGAEFLMELPKHTESSERCELSVQKKEKTIQKDRKIEP